MILKLKKLLPFNIYYFATIYLIGILFFTAFRIILFLTQIEQVKLIPDSTLIFFNSFLMGLRFDTVISCYILFFPILITSVLSFFKKDFDLVYKITLWIIILFYSIAFLIWSTDIPYFNHFFTHLTTALFPLMNNFAFSFEMILREPLFLVYFFALSGILFFYIKIILNFCNKLILEKQQVFLNHETNYLFFFFVLTSVFTILGARGRLDVKSPIRIGTAYTTKYPLANQLGLSPIYTFARSYLDDLQEINKEYSLMNNDEALENVKNFLNVKSELNYPPIARKINFNTDEKKYNVVLILLESMSTDKMGIYTNEKKSLTPFLDKISKNGILFSNIYSAGIHTYNGLFSTLTSMPSLMKRHTLKDSEIKEYSGLPKILGENGYKNNFLMTCDDQFDNMGGFLRANNFDQVFSDDDYPAEEILSNLGVPDHYLFNFGISEINKIANNEKTFFTTFLTASDHSPYVIPKNISFIPTSKQEKEKAVEYVDWSLEQFFKSAEKQSWFKNTIFIITGDHGAKWGKNNYDIPLSYHHIPLIIYSPNNISPSKNNNFGSQMDIFPTIMGLLKINYVNNTLGTDLINDKKPFAYFSADDKIGCIDENYYYINNLSVGESLFEYKLNGTENIIYQNKQVADKMKNYANSFIQSAQFLVNNKKTYFVKYE
ncbi:MAG: sulfatase-like hydrolase/transferase [Bacteroidetes bacterium]|nr:sulfatase-like hydrolase/transferase [Bacteroidota bacterium]